MILSFAWTTDVLLAGKKTCTRRVWSERTARAWVNAYQGERLLHSAWNKMPLFKGAKKIADIRLTQLPYQERLGDMPQSDLSAEGGLWTSKEEFIKLFGSPDIVVWVVRFELESAPSEEFRHCPQRAFFKSATLKKRHNSDIVLFPSSTHPQAPSYSNPHNLHPRITKPRVKRSPRPTIAIFHLERINHEFI